MLFLSCGNPCEDLGKKVCSCQTTAAAEAACVQRVKDEAKRTPITSTNKELCAEVIDGCSCEKLAAGDFKACGLATE